MEINAFITQSLSPAVAISAIGLLSLSLINRMGTVGQRIRQLNRELKSSTEPIEIENIQQQILNFMTRCRLIRNALFLLFTAMGLMVFTAFGIAISQLKGIPWHSGIPIVTFLSGLVCILFAVFLEAYEVTINLKTLKLDIELARTIITMKAQKRDAEAHH